MQIEIEKMMFGDYRVDVWNEEYNSMLDKEYFCRGFVSAVETAIRVKEDMFPKLDIYVREGDEVKLLDR